MFFKKNYDKIKNGFRRNRSFNILHNSFILYFMLFLSTINLVGCGLIGDFMLPTFFILIGVITSFFSKNMTVILTIALVSSNIIKYATKGGLYEGFEEDDSEIKKSGGKKSGGSSKENSDDSEDASDNIEGSDPSKKKSYKCKKDKNR